MAQTKKCLGIDFGSRNIKVVEMSYEKNGIKILNAVSADVSISEDASPQERNKHLANALKGLLKSNKIGTKEAVFCVPGQTVFVRRFPLPKTTPERLDKIIRFEARQQIHYPIDKTMLEYNLTDRPGGQEVDVFLVALKKDVLSDFMDLVNKTGLKPVGVSVSTLALFNFHSLDSMPPEDFKEKFFPEKKKISLKIKMPKLKLKKGKKKKAEEKVQEEAVEETESFEEEEEFEEFMPEVVRAYINVGETFTDISIGTAGASPVLGFTRSVPMAGKALTHALRDNMDGVDDMVEAERIKKEESHILTMDSEPESDKTQEASELCTNAADRIIAELRRSLDYYISQPDGMAVDEIVMSGGQSLMTNFPQYIEDKLGIPVFLYQEPVEDNIEGLNNLGEDLPIYTTSLGLAVTGIGVAPLQLDFLPPERKVAIKFKKKRGFVILLAAMVGGITFLGAISGDRLIEIYQRQTREYRSEIEEYSDNIDVIKKARERHTKLAENFEKASKALKAERDYPLERWLDILKSKPADVLVSSLQVLPHGKVIIDGYTEDFGSASTFASNLNASLLEKDLIEGEGALLSNIKSEYHNLFNKEVSKFTITMTFKGRRSRVMPKEPEPEEQQQTGGGRARGTLTLPRARGELRPGMY